MSPEKYPGAKAFVTGGTGFIGSHFLGQAMAAGHQIVALRRPGGRPRIPLAPEPQWVEGSLADDWRGCLTGCQTLVHLAAVGVSPLSTDWEQLFSVNVHQSLRLWLQAAEAGVKRLVIAGSCFEYGLSADRYEFIPADAPLEPAGPYHASKAAATMAAIGLCIERGLELIVLRPFAVFGSGEIQSRFWPSLKKAAFAGEDFPMSGGEQVRDFMPVEQLARAFVQALTRTDARPGFPLVENAGTGKPQSLRTFAEGWWRSWGATGKLRVGALPYRHSDLMRYVPRLSAGTE